MRAARTGKPARQTAAANHRTPHGPRRARALAEWTHHAKHVHRAPAAGGCPYEENPAAVAMRIECEGVCATKNVVARDIGCV